MPVNTIDLHIHSNHSDGAYSPQEIVRIAEKKGLRAIAVADHDTISHIKPVLSAGEGASLDVLAGVEVSAEFRGGTMHILGYFVDPDNNELYDMLNRFREGRDERNPQIIEKLNALGIMIDYEEVLQEAAGMSIGRPHIARVLVNKGVVSNMQEAFDKYLKKGAPAYVNRVRFSSQKIISVIKSAGGLAFLAHPKQLNMTDIKDLTALVEKLVHEGLDGIEVYSSCHTAEDIRTYETLTRTYDLLVCGGSDFHGISKPDIAMGFIGEGIELDYQIVEKMKARLKK